MTNKNNSILISQTIDEAILLLTMNHLDNRNALSENMISNLSEAISKASINEDIKVIIIASNGPVFSAGHELKEMNLARKSEDLGRAYFKFLFDSCSSLMQLIVNCPKPIIAQISGIATAAGCQLVASCDLAICSESSKFATPGVNLGLFCSTPMVALSRNINKKNAMHMLLTGEMIDAIKAKEIGLINNYVADKMLKKEVLILAKKIASKSSMTLAVGKKAFYRQSELNLSDAYEYTSNVMTENMLMQDAEEGINAFLQKRSPNWKDQ